MGNPRYPRTLTDEIVECLVPMGGEFNILRDQHFPTQGPGGVDVVRVTRGSKESEVIIVPRTDSIPPTEGPEQVIWHRR